MADNIQEVKTALEDISSRLSQKVEERDQQIQELGQATEANAKEISQLSTEYKTAHDELQGLSEDIKSVQSRLESVKTVDERQYKSLGQAFIESDVYKQYIENGAHQRSKDFAVGASLGGRSKTTFTGASLGNTPAYMYETDRIAEYIADPNRTRFVRELLPTFGVSTGSVEFVRETSYTNNAGMVPEYADTDSGEKPQSAIAFEVVTTPVRTMAHYIPITRQIVDDARQLQGYIENRLLYGLRLKEDQQLLYGTGTGDEVNGILTDTNIQTLDQTASETLIDAIRRAMTLAFVDEYSPSGVVIHHNDWEDIELTKGSDEHYIWVNVTQQNGTRLWGLPVVSTNAIQEGTVLVGDFARGSAVHDRENANIRISDSHADFFTKNLWALLAEERIAQSIYRPNAFVNLSVYSGV